jgi:hypothetical protein
MVAFREQNWRGEKSNKKVKLLNVWGFLEPNPCADSGIGVCIKLRKNASTHAPKQLGNQTQKNRR